MRIPAIQGIIDRRILANYRVDPNVVSHLLPSPFRPKLVNGFAIAGICLIRLKKLRPVFVPFNFGIGSENAAHRFAVEWDDDGQCREGVFIPRRDSSSRLNAWLGGRIVPGVHHHAKFKVAETPEKLDIDLRSDDRQVQVRISAKVSTVWTRNSVFDSLDEASQFFAAGSVGYSSTHKQNYFEGLELNCANWSVQALDVESIESNYFDDPERFPLESAKFDCALLMRGVRHMWRSLPDLCCDPIQRPQAASSLGV